MRRRLFFLVLLCILVLSVHGSEQGLLVRNISVTLLVSDPESAVDSIVRWGEDRGGYFLLRSVDNVVLRFPTGDVGDFRKFIEDISDELYDLSIEVFDVSEEIMSLRSGIQARQEILEKNLDYIDDVDVEGTLAIEREVSRLLAEIESMKGRLNRLTVDTTLARAQLFFTCRDASIPSDIPSSFGWINRVDFYNFMREGLR